MQNKYSRVCLCLIRFFFFFLFVNHAISIQLRLGSGVKFTLRVVIVCRNSCTNVPGVTKDGSFSYWKPNCWSLPWQQSCSSGIVTCVILHVHSWQYRMQTFSSGNWTKKMNSIYQDNSIRLHYISEMCSVYNLKQKSIDNVTYWQKIWNFLFM